MRWCPWEVLVRAVAELSSKPINSLGKKYFLSMRKLFVPKPFHKLFNKNQPPCKQYNKRSGRHQRCRGPRIMYPRDFNTLKGRIDWNLISYSIKLSAPLRLSPSFCECRVPNLDERLKSTLIPWNNWEDLQHEMRL